MQNRTKVLLTALLITPPVIAADQYSNPFDAQSWGESPVVDTWGYERAPQRDAALESEAQGPSKDSLLAYLEKKRVRAKARLSLIEEEIRCVEQGSERDGSFWSCYEMAKQKREALKQQYGTAQSPYQRRAQQGGGMPNFERMGMGMMPMPW